MFVYLKILHIIFYRLNRNMKIFYKLKHICKFADCNICKLKFDILKLRIRKLH